MMPGQNGKDSGPQETTPRVTSSDLSVLPPLDPRLEERRARDDPDHPLTKATNKALSKLLKLRAAGLQKLIRGDKDHLKDDYTTMLAIAMYTGEDLTHTINNGKELAKILAWGGKVGKGGGQTAHERMREAEEERRKKKGGPR